MRHERPLRLLAALGNAHALDLGIVGTLLQAADLREQRAALALKTGNLAGGIALGGARLLDGRIGLDDLIRNMLKRGSKIGSRPSARGYDACAPERPKPRRHQAPREPGRRRQHVPPSGVT